MKHGKTSFFFMILAILGDYFISCELYVSILPCFWKWLMSFPDQKKKKKKKKKKKILASPLTFTFLVLNTENLG